MIIAGVILIVLLAGFAGLYIHDRTQQTHAILRNFPILGRIRYASELVGPEFRQYWFEADTEGKPFSRVDFKTVVLAAKYLTTLIGFGSQRDFDAPGFYLKNAMFPALLSELRVDNRTRIATHKYMGKETVFSRVDTPVSAEAEPWLLAEEDAVVIGGETCREPWRVRGLFGMSAMSYGALGSHAIQALSRGIGIAGGSWMNTGEGGVSEHHLAGNADIIAQMGPALFGFRDDEGHFSEAAFLEHAANPKIKAFEIKLAQGAKIRGGHLEGKKVTPEIARIRKVRPWKTVESPNRHASFHDIPSMLAFADRIRELGGKPVGIKLVIGSEDGAEDLARTMWEMGTGPDFITVDGGEGGSGATFQEMADTMGLPLRSGLVILDNSLRKWGVRGRVKIIASGKLFSADRMAIALGLGADLCNVARGFMIAVGCIGAQRCHSNTCPVGVATTDPRLMKALVVEEKQYRVANYIVTMRQGLFTLAAASGLTSPTRFTREHVIWNDGAGRARSAAKLFPVQEETI